MFVAECLLSSEGQRARSPNHILDLAAVYFLLAQLVQLIHSQTGILWHIWRRYFVEHGFLQKCNPYLAFGVSGKVLIVQRNMDTRLEGLIEGPNAICGQEEDATEVPNKCKD